MSRKDKNNPEWTKKDFKKARPMKEDMPGLVKALKRGPGRPVSDSPKQHIGMRLDADIVEWLRGHKGYNALVNKALRREMEKGR